MGIATAILGFGLFSVEFQGLGALVAEKGRLQGGLHAASVFLFASVAFMFYIRLIAKVSYLLHKPDPSGPDVAKGPLADMGVIVALIGVVLLLNRL